MSQFFTVPKHWKRRVGVSEFHPVLKQNVTSILLEHDTIISFYSGDLIAHRWVFGCQPDAQEIYDYLLSLEPLKSPEDEFAERFIEVLCNIADALNEINETIRKKEI